MSLFRDEALGRAGGNPGTAGAPLRLMRAWEPRGGNCAWLLSTWCPRRILSPDRWRRVGEYAEGRPIVRVDGRLRI
jgi:hypothetical protein